MKVIVFSEKFWPEGSGGELATYLILKLLASIKDFKIKVYTSTGNPAQVPGVSINTVSFLKASNKIQLFFNILANRWRIEKIVEKADFVYIPGLSYPIIPIAKRMGKKVIVHLHSYQPVSYTAAIFSDEISKPMNDFKRSLIFGIRSGSMLRSVASAMAVPLTKLIKKWVSMADKIVCVSRRHEEMLLKFAPEYKGKTLVVYNPPPEVPSIEKNLSDKLMLLYIGGDSYVKGFHVLLQALKMLGRRKQTNFKLILTNKYSQRSLKTLENLKRLYHLDIQVLGRISYGDLMKLHSRTWALLFPSIWEEPLPYAVAEAMLLGTIPISSKVGGVIELLEGTVAEDFMFAPGDEFELAEKVEYVATMNEQEVQEVSLKLRKDALSKLDVERSARELVKLFGSSSK